MSESMETPEGPKVLAGRAKPEGTPVMGGEMTPSGTEIVVGEEEAQKPSTRSKRRRGFASGKLVSKKPPLYLIRTSKKP